LQKRRNFGGEVLLHGAERVFGGWNPKGRAAPFLCPKFSRVQCLYTKLLTETTITN
jgi:hypothetical protein